MDAVTNTGFSLSLYELVRTRTDEKTAKEAVQVIEGLIESKLSHTASKEDILRLENKIAESKNDMIKWFFAFFITLTLMILGLYGAIFFK